MSKDVETMMLPGDPAQTAAPIIEMSGVTKWYGDVQVLKDIDFRRARRAGSDLRPVRLRQVNHDPMHQPAGGTS